MSYTLRLCAILSLSLSLLTALSLAKPVRRDDVSVQTGFINHECNATQAQILWQAKTDALELARASYDYSWWSGNYIDWDSEAALDFFGSSAKPNGFRAYILETLVRGGNIHEGFGYDDWRYGRYVDVYCGGDACDDSTPGYNSDPGGSNPERGSKYPEIHFCPVFFDVLKPHGVLADAIRADRSGQMKKNLRNLRSQATTFLHELLHVNGTSAELCLEGCIDIMQTIGRGESVRSYKAGRSKLLAARNGEVAARNNDNYAYFAMARWMEKNFGTYPNYPARWDRTLTFAENMAREAKEPGAASNVYPWEMDDKTPPSKADSARPVVNSDHVPVTEYPLWYQPKVIAGSSLDLPAVSPPFVLSPAPRGTQNAHCETTAGSPQIRDCMPALDALASFGSQGALHGKKDKSWWAQYVKSCAIEVHYVDDWDNTCNATLADIHAHATTLLNHCANGGLHTVGGYTEFNNPACPSRVQFINTRGRTPPDGA